MFGVVVPVYPFLLQATNIASATNVQLYTSILTAAFPISDLITAPICAFYVDHYHSRRVPWFIGLAGIVAGNVLFGVGNSFGLLLASRLLQGAASAILYTVGLAVLVESVDKGEVGTFMGSAMSANNFGIIMSPLLGGALYEKRGKMAVLGLMTAIIVLDITMRMLMKERCPDESTTLHGNPKQIDKQVDEKSKDTPEVTIQAADAISISTTLGSQEQTTHETLDGNDMSDEPNRKSEKRIRVSSITRLKGVMKLIRSPRLLAALYGCFINECIVASLCAVLPLFVERTFHWNSLQAGCLFLAIAIPGLGGSLAGHAGGPGRSTVGVCCGFLDDYAVFNRHDGGKTGWNWPDYVTVCIAVHGR